MNIFDEVGGMLIQAECKLIGYYGGFLYTGVRDFVSTILLTMEAGHEDARVKLSLALDKMQEEGKVAEITYRRIGVEGPWCIYVDIKHTGVVTQEGAWNFLRQFVESMHPYLAV